MDRTHSVPLKQASFCGLLMGAYEMGVSILLRDDVKDILKHAVAQLHLCEVVLAVKQVMLYIRTFVENFNKVSIVNQQCLITENCIYNQIIFVVLLLK